MRTETFRTSYASLFEVQVLHRYFLNVGTAAFDAAAPPAAVRPALAVARRLYDVRRFWRLEPDAPTRTALRDGRLVFKALPDGFRVGVPVDDNRRPAVALPDELTLTFGVWPTDGFFALYTDISRAVLDALTHPTAAVPQGQLFAWTNAGGSPALNAGETIRAADLRPRPAGGEAGAPPLGLIEIRHRAGGSPSLLDGTGRVTSPVFRAVLGNRATRWEYQGADVGQFPLVQAGRVPVTGGSPARPLPNPTPATTADRGTAFVSVIY